MDFSGVLFDLRLSCFQQREGYNRRGFAPTYDIYMVIEYTGGWSWSGYKHGRQLRPLVAPGIKTLHQVYAVTFF